MRFRLPSVGRRISGEPAIRTSMGDNGVYHEASVAKLPVYWPNAMSVIGVIVAARGLYGGAGCTISSSARPSHDLSSATARQVQLLSPPRRGAHRRAAIRRLAISGTTRCRRHAFNTSGGTRGYGRSPRRSVTPRKIPNAGKLYSLRKREPRLLEHRRWRNHVYLDHLDSNPSIVILPLHFADYADRTAGNCISESFADS